MAGGNETPKEERQEPSVRRGSKSIWPWKKETDGSASFLRAARAGNLEKVLEFLKTNTDINTCNANGLNALHLASKEGHTNVVSALLERSANVDSATKKGNTALHIASLAGQDEIVKVLVENGATVNIQSQNGFTPLYMAAQENHDSVVRFLLSHGANQSLATEDGFTPLAVALQQGHDRVVSVLLENDTRGKVRLPALHIAAKKDDAKAAALLLHTDHNPDITSKSGFTPLHIASHYGNDNIAGLLIQRGADVNYVAKHQITPLHVASKWGKGNMVSLLLDKGANIEAKTRDGLTPLHCAARSGHETVVDMLLEKGAPITAKTKNGLAPLHMASQGDHVDAARILLYHKAPVDDVTVDFLTALHVAAHCGHVRVAKLLLDRKADPNSRALNGFTPLHIACKKNRIKVVELLLKHGASIEATTESGLTPLHVASFMGCMNIVIYLIQHGASADVPTVRGESPLHLAARANQTDIIRILLRNGAEVDAKAREQQTALHIASRLGNTDIVGLLLQQGASVDAPTKDLYTPLHIAAKEGQEEVAGVLLDHGASLNTATKKGFTPLHLAAKYGHLKVARLLLQREAPVDPKGKNGVTPLHVAAHYDNQNVAMLLLDKGAQPHATAKNGYTPLHIAARKNQMDIAGTLLEYGANANAESKAGFTPLHLSAQEGHTDMATLLLEHGAQPGGAAKNGLTPLHLCAQEDRVPVGAILVKHGAAVDVQTKAGYTPLHVAAHFGQMNMVRFLLQHGTKVDAPTQLGYTPLHQAAQQGHTQIVNLLLENKAQPNMETNDGKTALSIAQRLGYISVVETLKIVTETRVVTNTTTTTEEKYKVVVPETMHETFMSESEDEGADDTMLGDQSYRYLTVDEMKSLGDDSLPIDVTRDEKMDVSFVSNVGSAPGDHISPLHKKEMYGQNYPTDNIDVGKAPILAGPESLNTTMNTSFNLPEDDARIVNDESRAEVPDQGTTQSQSHLPATVTSKATHAEEVNNIWDQFLVSFMVDARGGAMRGCRHSGVRVIIPPRKAAMPMRITCRYLKKDKLVHAPPLMEGEALSSRILEMGPSGAKFLGPVIIEVPHFASLRGKEREIVILRSDNGETWREHTLEATEEAVQEVLNESFDGEELKQLEDLNTNRITRILTTDFPQYFAIVTRIRQEVHAIGPEGGMVSSTVVPQVQAVFPQGALTKKIKVGLQAQPISTDLVAKLLGNRVAVSPIVTVEPRRRKFHKPITLTIPVPQAASKGMINQYSGEAPTLRLLCSITGGTTRAQWEDVTGSTPLTFVNDCVSFTTTVSARFWLMDCTNIPEATKMATELYREAIHVPFMAKFVVFSKRHQLEEARVRVFCMTDDKEDKTLESQEHFIEVAKSRDVEVLEGKSQYLEFAGNLIPVTKSGDQLAFNFYAFRENRLPFTVRVKDQNAESCGRVAFMRQPKVGRGDAPQSPICNLNLSLPDNIQPEPAPSEPDLLALEKKYAFLSISKAETIHKADLRLSDISNMLTGDWVALAKELEISDSDINIIKSQYPDNTPQQAVVMLRLWMQTAGNKATGNTLEKALRSIHRDDIVDECICNLEVVTDVSEKATAEKALIKEASQGKSIEEALPIKRTPSPETYEEKDLMKDAESADEDEVSHKIIADGLTQPSAESSQMVSSDVKPPVIAAAGESTSEPQQKKKVTGTGPSEERIKLEQELVSSLNNGQDKSSTSVKSSNIISNNGFTDFKIVPSLSLSNTTFDTTSTITTTTSTTTSCEKYTYSLIDKNRNDPSNGKEALENLRRENSGTQAYTEETLEDALSVSAHRPTTLKISSSTEVNENETQTNDSCSPTRENETQSEESRPSDCYQLKNEADVNPLKNHNSSDEHLSESLEEDVQRPQVSSGAISRPERSFRPSARSAAVLKVKVEKRPIANHSSRERSLASQKETVLSASQHSKALHRSKAQNTTIEDEMIGLMAEVKEVTNQIKKEVRQLRESETPTPETPTPLREFRDFLSNEEEQELERLPTIKETGKEIEEEGPANGVPGEMDCNLTLKNHISTINVTADNGQHNSSVKDTSHTVVPQIKKSSYSFKNAVAKVRRNLNNNNVFDPLVVKPQPEKCVVNLESPTLSSSLSCKLSHYTNNNTQNTNSDLKCKSLDINSIFFDKTHLFLNSNRCCNYCNKDFLLNDVSNDLVNIISVVEEGIKFSKRININNIIDSLDILKYKVGGLFDNSFLNSKSRKIPLNVKDANEHSSFVFQETTSKNINPVNKVIDNESTETKTNKYIIMTSVKDNEPEKHQPFLHVPNLNEANGPEYMTDVEEVNSEDENNSQGSLIVRETVTEDISEDKLTDMENIEGSESEGELECKEEKISLEDFLRDDAHQTLILTEGFARNKSSQLSGGEYDSADVQLQDIEARSLNNTIITNVVATSISQDIPQHLTDEEEFSDSIYDLHQDEKNIADTIMPEQYLQETKSVLDHEIVKSVPFVSKNDFGVKKSKSCEKQTLNTLDEVDGTTDVEDLAVTNLTYKNQKPKRKKPRQKKCKSFPKTPPTLAPNTFDERVTDTEVLINTTDTSGSEGLDDFNENLTVALNEFRGFTDSEEMRDSDLEDVDFLTAPVVKDKALIIPEPYFEDTRIFEQAELELRDDIHGETDEENFNLNEMDDGKCLIPAPFKFNIVSATPHLSDSDEEENEALTDTDDFKMEEKDEEDIINDIVQRFPNEDTSALLHMEIQSDAVSHVKSNLMEPVSKFGNVPLNEETFTLTDVEDWDEHGGISNFKKNLEISNGRRTDETDSDIVDDSEEENTSHLSKYKSSRKQYKKHLVQQLSDLKFVETEHGPLSIIITPDTCKDEANPIEDNIKGIVFLEGNDDAITDSEEIGISEDKKYTMSVVPSVNEPLQEVNTDTEDFERPDSANDRPLTPMPPDVAYFPCSKREKIYIVEDEYGIPHVKIEEDDSVNELPDENIQELTDTEDFAVHDDELDQLIDESVPLDHDDSGIILETELTEVLSKYKTKKSREVNKLHKEMETHTDVEDISRTRRKRKSKSRKSPEIKVEEIVDQTDVEILNADVIAKLPIFKESQIFTFETEYEHFETSGEDWNTSYDNEAVSENIHESGIKNIVIHKENQDGTFITELQEEHKHPRLIALVEESHGTTDIETLGISDVEEVGEVAFPKDQLDSTLPENEESKVTMSVKAFTPRFRRAEQAEIKENLLLPEGKCTDVESLDEEEETKAQRTISEDSSKGEAPMKTPLLETDIAVLENLLTSQEADVKGMSKSKATTEVNTHQTPKVDQSCAIDTSKVDDNESPMKVKHDIQKTTPAPSLITLPAKENDSSRSESKVKHSSKNTSAELCENISSDDGEDQLALMKDSPRWEEEEIQTEDSADLRPIKAEIKLMVKTTEVGKESIEIRSIREFVEPCEKENTNLSDGKEEAIAISIIGEPPVSSKDNKGSSLSNERSTSSPKFVRPKEKYPFYDEGTDDFDLISQVRDIIAETEKENDISTIEGSPKSGDKKKKKKGPK